MDFADQMCVLPVSYFALPCGASSCQSIAEIISSRQTIVNERTKMSGMVTCVESGEVMRVSQQSGVGMKWPWGYNGR